MNRLAFVIAFAIAAPAARAGEVHITGDGAGSSSER
jgi:hypothetical protein